MVLCRSIIQVEFWIIDDLNVTLRPERNSSGPNVPILIVPIFVTRHDVGIESIASAVDLDALVALRNIIVAVVTR